MKTLLIVNSAAEVVAGLALVFVPSSLLSFMLGSPSNVAVIVCRVAGTALLTIGIACWWMRNDSQSRVETGLIVTLLVYDVIVVAIPSLARCAMRFSGIRL